MITEIPHQWKSVVLESVGINEFTDMYVQGIGTYVKEDMTPNIVDVSEFDTVLTDEFLEGMILDLKMFIVKKQDQLKDILITYQISLVRAVLLGIELPKDLRKVNYMELEQEIDRVKREKWAATEHLLMTHHDNAIKSVCQELNISQKDLAARLGIDEDTVKDWANTNELPTWAFKFIDLIAENEKNKTIANKLKELIHLTMK